ncbi:hypothetical protein [Methyloraptor flagellatus]|uniref:GNAT family N-acetyltransferase n=1 Tax=Methyloraptor flagellatus TaxID=3162530 RepID=A0AAU7XI24_9HYPH
MTAAIRIEPLAEGHRPAWERLYAGYAAFYRVAQTAEMRARVWSWIMDPAHEVNGIVAIGADGEPVGLAHFRPSPGRCRRRPAGFSTICSSMPPRVARARRRR